MNFLELQPLTVAQLPAALELDQLCFGGLWTLEGYQRELDSPNSDLLVLVPGNPATLAPSTESLFASDLSHHSLTLLGLGCLWAILEEAHITILAIHPTYQRQGLGQVLLWALLKTARTRGLERATLEVRASNQVAIALYQKFGFREAGRRRHYYPDTGEDGLVLWLNGLQTPKFEQDLTQWQVEINARLAQAGWRLKSSIGS